jgi:DNA primase
MVRIPQAKIDEIQGSADIVAYISRYVNLKQTGKNFKGLCPFHKEKTPSLIVSPEKQIFHCFGCGKGGNVIGFMMEFEKISYPEALRRLATDAGITLTFEGDERSATEKSEFEPLYQANQSARDFFLQELEHKNAQAARAYLAKRNLKNETLNKFEIGYAPHKWDGLVNAPALKAVPREILNQLGLIQKKENSTGSYFDQFRNRIMFPFHNLSGKIVGFGGRRLVESDQPKYLNSSESRIYKKGQILYGLYQAIPAIRDNKFVILVEGYFDLLRLVDSGILNVVASSGTALTEDQGRLLRRYTTTVFISYDSDEAGIQSALRNSFILESLDLNVSIIQLPVPHDPDTFISENGNAAYVALLQRRVSPLELQLQRFYKQTPRPAADEKNRFANEVMQQLQQIRDEIKIGMYLHQLAQALEIPETFLISSFRQSGKRTGVSPVPAAGTVPEKSASRIHRGKRRAEEGILSVLLLNDAVSTKYILNQLAISDFENEDLRRLFEMLSENWEERGRISIHDLTSEISEEERNLLSALLLHEIQDVRKFTADCVYQIKKWALDQRYNEIRRLKHTESTDAGDTSLQYARELNTIRKKLSEIDAEHSKYLKINL